MSTATGRGRLALPFLLTLALVGCDPRRDWLEDRRLAALAHCPPPELGRGEQDTCQALAWMSARDR